MSQYKKQQGDLQILYGWDQPLRYYFLVVEVPNGNPATVWCNLNLRRPGLSLGELRLILEGFGARLTDEEIETLAADADPRIREEPWPKGASSKGDQ